MADEEHDLEPEPDDDEAPEVVAHSADDDDLPCTGHTGSCGTDTAAV